MIARTEEVITLKNIYHVSTNVSLMVASVTHIKIGTMIIFNGIAKIQEKMFAKKDYI